MSKLTDLSINLLLTGGVQFLVKDVHCEKETLWFAKDLLMFSGKDLTFVVIFGRAQQILLLIADGPLLSISIR